MNVVALLYISFAFYIFIYCIWKMYIYKVTPFLLVNSIWLPMYALCVIVLANKFWFNKFTLWHRFNEETQFECT